MVIIKNICNDIENELKISEDYAKKAVQYKLEYPSVAQCYLEYSNAHLSIMNGLHQEVVNLITNYRKINGEPPAPMLAIYNYLHERFIEMARDIKSLQEMF